MESETKQVMQKQKLEVHGILREAVMIYVKNPNFIIFAFLTSLPLFCFMVYFEVCLQETLVETWKIIYPPYVHGRYYHRLMPFLIMNRFSKDYFLKLIQLGLIYMVPLHVLEFGPAIVAIDLASKLRSEEKKMTLKEMFHKPFDLSNVRGAFITSIYVLFLSTCHLLGLLWIAVFYHVCLKEMGCDYMLFAVICILAFAKLLRMYLEWSAMWNMSLVISVLEGTYGVEALATSADFSRGNERRGLFLMLVFFAWGHFLRLASLHMGGYEEGKGIVIQVGLFCMVNMLKWVACMIYFHDCKERNLEKETDEELGKDLKMVHE